MVHRADIEELQRQLKSIIPDARLEVVSLPGCPGPGLRLHLLQGNYPQHELAPAEAARIMDNPLYWVFCWASGRVLAAHIMKNPELVRAKRVLDFGCGSGVVAIAAALAGADSVVACDNDPLALIATRANADLNGVTLDYADDFASIVGEVDLITVADVLYDRANLPWLDVFVGRAAQVLVADSRVRDFDVPPYSRIATGRSSTLPDLDESAEFGLVTLYEAGLDSTSQATEFL